MVFKFIVFLVILIVGFQSAVTVTHQLDIKYTNGLEVKHTKDNANIPGSTPVSRVCNSAIWIIYDEPYFSNEGFVQILLPHSAGQCHKHAINTIRSARMVGSRININLPSATFFNRVGLRGDVIVIDGGVPDLLLFPIMSFVTIYTNWIEFFREVDYKGKSFCIQLRSPDTTWYWNWEELPNIPWHGTLAKSARLGCNKGDSVIVRP